MIVLGIRVPVTTLEVRIELAVRALKLDENELKGEVKWKKLKNEAFV